MQNIEKSYYYPQLLLLYDVILDYKIIFIVSGIVNHLRHRSTEMHDNNGKGWCFSDSPKLEWFRDFPMSVRGFPMNSKDL